VTGCGGRKSAQDPTFLAGDIPEGGEHFAFRAGVPDPKTQTYQVAEIAFAPDGMKGTENLLFNHAVWEIQGSEAFLGRWHRARVAYDMTGYTGFVWIDGEPVLVGVPLQPDLNVQDRPEISLTRLASVPIALWIDDVEVGFQDISLFGKNPTEVEPQRIFRDNFNRYEGALFPLQGGWIFEGDEAQQAEKLKAETTNGNIRLEGLTFKDGIVAETTNGSITLAIASPEALNANLLARTTNGHITVDFPVTLKNLSQSKHRVEAKIGQGGPEISLETTNGSIRITK